MFLRAGTVLTASALAFTLGTGPASAAETTAAAAAATPAPAPAPAEVGIAARTIDSYRIGSGLINTRATTWFPGDVRLGVGDGTGSPQAVTTSVRINGRFKGNVALYPNGVEIPRAWGSGKVRLGPSTISYRDQGPSSSPTLSNVFYARKTVKSTAGYPLKVRRVNSRVTFKARGIKIINPRTGKYQSVKRVKLQQLKGGSWKTKKTIRLNRAGNGSYKTSIKKKYRYRLYVPRTSTQEKFETVRTGKI
jgi:pyruvate/2-oxoglutarate dehydrogenase complex dihydrolipoamide acyltransferase (E2) component